MRAAIVLILLAGCATPKEAPPVLPFDFAPQMPVAACMAEIERLKEAGNALARKYDAAQDDRDEAQKSALECRQGRST